MGPSTKPAGAFFKNFFKNLVTFAACPHFSVV